MVMHARKIPRLNDGLYDRNQSHPFEEKYPSKSHGSNYVDRHSDKNKYPPSGSRHRDQSPNDRPSPRYQNKSSYMEKQRERQDSRGDKRANHYSANTSSSTRGHQSRPQGRDTKEQKAGTQKIDIQKSALRVVGDWSEHKSSSGKIYYYNIKTEVSQWEKPREWGESSAVRTNDNGRPKETKSSVSSSKGLDDRYKHSSGPINDRYPQDRNHRNASQSSQGRATERTLSHGGYNSSEKYRQSQGSSRSSGESTLHKSGHRTWHGSGDNSHSYGDKRDRMSRGSVDSHDRNWDRYHPHTNYSPSSNKYAAVDGNRNGARYDHSRNENEDSRQTEDMDISPGSTPTHNESKSRPISRIGTPLVLPGSTPSTQATNTSSLAHPTGPLHQRIDSQDITQQTIQTLQQLQKALIAAQQQKIHAPPAQSPRHPASNEVRSPLINLQSPQIMNSQQGNHNPRLQSSQSTDEGRDSPKSEHSYRSSRASPTPSHGSSQGIPVGMPSLTTTTTKKPETIQLTPSHNKYYNIESTRHVAGWQTDHLERQADLIGEEAHNIGSQHCTQVSADLKKARSYVRIAEIQSTLQEQRILFLRQHIKNLENMRSQNTFMPSQQQDRGRVRDQNRDKDTSKEKQLKLET